MYASKARARLREEGQQNTFLLWTAENVTGRSAGFETRSKQPSIPVGHTQCPSPSVYRDGPAFLALRFTDHRVVAPRDRVVVVFVSFPRARRARLGWQRVVRLQRRTHFASRRPRCRKGLPGTPCLSPKPGRPPQNRRRNMRLRRRRTGRRLTLQSFISG